MIKVQMLLYFFFSNIIIIIMMLIFMVNTMHVRSNERTTFYSGELNVTPSFLRVCLF